MFGETNKIKAFGVVIVLNVTFMFGEYGLIYSMV
jgi:hypothetical protein